jgi:dTDP-glucose pyrophosphorylase
MILITLAGASSRFFNAGYEVVKYKLPLNRKTIIECILEFIPREEKLLLILNKKFHDLCFMEEMLSSMKFNNSMVVEIDNTRGQFETVILGLNQSLSFWNEFDYLTIYNGDTVRKINNWNFYDCDGFIEVFESDGTHWSFVDQLGQVNKVVEKNRISSLCSSGLYFFKHIKYLFDSKEEYYSLNSNELFVAPFYNLLIKKGLNIQSGIVESENFLFCGTPTEYHESLFLV